MMAHIGIFDTGFGGEYVAEQFKPLHPNDTFTVVNDRAHLPYGDRSQQEIIELTDQAIQPLLGTCDVIVIACNTATTLAIKQLREMHPDMRFVGFEPMIKPAASLTRSGLVATLATPATLKSERYQLLKQQWASTVRVLEPDCSTWAPAIEAGRFNEGVATQLATQLADQGADIISLACTHYLYLQSAMQEAVGNKATILSPLMAVHAQLTRVLHLVQKEKVPRP